MKAGGQAGLTFGILTKQEKKTIIFRHCEFSSFFLFFVFKRLQRDLEFHSFGANFEILKTGPEEKNGFFPSFLPRLAFFKKNLTTGSSEAHP